MHLRPDRENDCAKRLHARPRFAGIDPALAVGIGENVAGFDDSLRDGVASAPGDFVAVQDASDLGAELRTLISEVCDECADCSVDGQLAQSEFARVETDPATGECLAYDFVPDGDTDDNVTYAAGSFTSKAGEADEPMTVTSTRRTATSTRWSRAGGSSKCSPSRGRTGASRSSPRTTDGSRSAPWRSTAPRTRRPRRWSSSRRAAAPRTADPGRSMTGRRFRPARGEGDSSMLSPSYRAQSSLVKALGGVSPQTRES